MDDLPFDWASCLEQVRSGDEPAARRLVEQLYPLVIKIVRSHYSPRLAEEDLAQEIYAKVFSRLDQYRGQVPLEHWVARVAVNTCLNALRAQKSRPEWRWADLPEDEANALQAAMTGTEAPVGGELAARELVGKLLDGLSAEDRLVISLLDLEEKSVAEVCQVTGWGSAMVKVRAFRARRKMRKHLERMQSQEKL
jgi:RNA polymerase sigma-70 factor (ECF subfamily)